MCPIAGCAGVVNGPPATTSTIDFAEKPVATEQADVHTPEPHNHPTFRENTPEPYNHPAFRDNTPVKPADSAVGGIRTGSTTPDSASVSASAGTGSVVTGTSEQSDKFVGGSHQMNDVKLPGYWTHERTAELQKMAKNDPNIDPNGTSVPEPKAAPQCNQCDEDKKAGLFKKEFKRKGFFKKLLQRKS